MRREITDGVVAERGGVTYASLNMGVDIMKGRQGETSHSTGGNSGGDRAQQGGCS